MEIMEEKKPKGTMSLRSPETSIDQINEMKALFGASAGKVVERAVSYLYNNRIDIAEADHKERISSAK